MPARKASVEDRALKQKQIGQLFGGFVAVCGLVQLCLLIPVFITDEYSDAYRIFWWVGFFTLIFTLWTVVLSLAFGVRDRGRLFQIAAPGIAQAVVIFVLYNVPGSWRFAAAVVASGTAVVIWLSMRLVRAEEGG